MDKTDEVIERLLVSADLVTVHELARAQGIAVETGEHLDVVLCRLGMVEEKEVARVLAQALDIPIVASGGFGDARGLVAALALGAEGMNMGTRFCATQEAPLHINVKQALVDADERSTRLVMRTLRNTERVLNNAAVSKVLEIEAKGDATIEDIAPYVSGQVGKKMFEEGDMDSGVMSAGQVMGLINDIPTCEELISRIVREAEEIINSRLTNVTGVAVG